MGQSLINGQAWSFVDSRITAWGVEMYSATQITATEKQDKTNNYANQTSPVSRGRGKKEYEANFDFALKDTLKLRKLSPTQKLTDLPPTTCLIFLDNGIDTKEFTLPFFEFLEDGLEFGDGDTEARRSYPGIMSDIIIT